MALWGERGIQGWAVLAALLILVCAAQAETKREAAPALGVNPAPVVRIEVVPLGYVAPSPAYLNFRWGLISLDFIDDQHLLFTFHSKALMERLPGDPADDDDQVIHADVLDIASGKVLRQTDWRMHDKLAYLWALRDGRFLVRQRNSLFLTDSSLELRPYLTFDTDLEAIEISPGRNLMLIEVKKTVAAPENEQAAADGQSLMPPSFISSRGIKLTRTEMLVVRPGEKTVLMHGLVRNPMSLPLLDDGYLEVREGVQPKQWLIKKELMDKTSQDVGEVRSSCMPELVPLNEKVALAENCPVNGAAGNAISALSLAGGVLWQDMWQSKYVWAVFDYAEDGSRFAYESLEMNRQIGTMDAFGEADVVAQPVGVFDTETGKLELVKDASPILSGGHNFALSADGRRFAILREGAIEVYDLPQVTEAASAEQKKK